MNTILNKNFRLIFPLIILAELLSFLGYYYPSVNLIGFIAIAVLTLVLSLYKLEYGLFLLLIDLIIDSMGYLFSFKQAGIIISARLALWLILMSVWLGQVLVKWIKNKKLEINFSSSAYFSYFLILFIFIAWGMVNGLISRNNFSNIFFDANGWMFFTLVLPIYDIVKDKKIIEKIVQIFFAAAAWLSFKTIIILYFFSHQISGFNVDLYGWIRDTRIGEITRMSSGFYRIFMQSHIFVLIGFFVLLFSSFFLLLTFFTSAIIISFSRSFWVGLITGLILSFIYLAKKKLIFRKALYGSGYLISVVLASMILVGAVVKFPFPKVTGAFNLAVLEERSGRIENEAAAASRWALLPKLWEKIKTDPFFGKGFGATVTYQSSDPRQAQSGARGFYTTYAFEWGWLDVWLKLGLFGFLAYLALFVKIIKDGLKINSRFSLSLITGLAVLMAVNIFSPYVNHPLGIGYLLITAAIMESLKLKNNQDTIVSLL